MMVLQRVLMCIAGAVLMLGFTGGQAAAAPAPSAHMSNLVVAQPSSVCGYTQHALEQMAARGITPLDVQMTVALGADSAFLNRRGNWQYESGGTIVTMNDTGCVVTVMHR